MNNAITKYISIALLGISAVMAALFFLDMITENPYIIWTYILAGIAVVFSIAFSIARIFTSKKAARSSLISLGIVAVIILLGYVLASGEILTFSGYEEFYYEDNSMDPHVFSKLVGTGIYMMYIFGIVAIVSMIYSEISKIFK